MPKWVAFFFSFSVIVFSYFHLLDKCRVAVFCRDEGHCIHISSEGPTCQVQRHYSSQSHRLYLSVGHYVVLFTTIMRRFKVRPYFLQNISQLSSVTSSISDDPLTQFTAKPSFAMQAVNVTYQDGLPVHRRSPIQILTGSDLAQLRWSRPTRYH